MPANVAGALVFVIHALTTICLFVLLLRIWLPILRADFRNPIAQAILKFTSPLVIPVRRFVPSIGRLDTATVLIAVAVQCLALLLTLLILGQRLAIPESAVVVGFLFNALQLLLVHSISLFLYAIFIHIIISWVARGQYSPVAALVATLSKPVLRPIQRFLPPLGGFDLSPIIAIIALRALTIIVAGFSI